MKRLIFLAIALFPVFMQITSAQSNKEPAPGTWRVHLPYQANYCVERVGNKLYCGSPSGLFTFNTDDNSIERLSKHTGLSDVEVDIFRYYESKKMSIVIYANTNIDLLDHQTNEIINIPDILQKSMIGKKTVNSVFFHENKAYLACSFGVVVVDLDKKQITESYQNLGANGAQIEFLSLVINDNSIFASAADGIYRASLNAPNLSDFKFWAKSKASLYSNQSCVFKNQVYAVIDSTVKIYDGIGSWIDWPQSNSTRIKTLKSSNNKLIFVAEEHIVIENSDGTFSKKPLTFRNDAVIDERGFLAMVDNLFGLTFERTDNGNIDYYNPNGPAGKTFGKMLYYDKKLWVTGGYVNDVWSPLIYNNTKFSTFFDNTWYNYSKTDHPAIDNAKDFIDIRKNPYTNEIYLSSFGTGIFEVKNDIVTNVYDDKNSSLQRLQVADPNYNPLLSGGMDFDIYGNLWVSNFGASKPLSVKSKSGWTSFSIGTLLVGNEIGWVTCDDYNNVWANTLKDKGILVYNHAGTPNNPNDDTYKLLTKDAGQGGLPSNTVLCMSLDQRGEMWIGTNQGLAILSNPGLIFNNKKSSFDARQIIIQVGSNYEIFLGKEVINCIKVDPANRKWIGTRNGVHLVSPDGYTLLKTFTISNSPLLSNNVIEIGIDEKTGEVFFGTEKGIISYVADATKGAETFNEVKIFPNPVRPEFTDNITIRGLVNNAIVKITDISGNLVYETTANGGTATWNGRNFSGKRASTGVYLIMSADEDGNQSYAGKLVFIH